MMTLIPAFCRRSTTVFIHANSKRPSSGSQTPQLDSPIHTTLIPAFCMSWTPAPDTRMACIRDSRRHRRGQCSCRRAQSSTGTARRLLNYCRDGRCTYLDYFSAMVDRKGLMRKEFADDGVHPTDAGYAVMAPLAEKAIRKALGRRTDTQ